MDDGKRSLLYVTFARGGPRGITQLVPSGYPIPVESAGLSGFSGALFLHDVIELSPALEVEVLGATASQSFLFQVKATAVGGTTWSWVQTFARTRRLGMTVRRSSKKQNLLRQRVKNGRVCDNGGSFGSSEWRWDDHQQRLFLQASFLSIYARFL